MTPSTPSQTMNANSSFLSIDGPIFRSVVPPLEDRQVLQENVLVGAMLPTLGVLFMAYLSQRPNTYAYRLAILPLALWLSLRRGFAYRLVGPGTNTLNLVNGFGTLLDSFKLLEYGLATQPIRKLSRQSRPARTRTKDDSVLSRLWNGVSDAISLYASCRGYEYEPRIQPPPYTPPPAHDTKNRSNFLVQTARAFLIHFLLFDIIEKGFKYVPGAGTPDGGSIFFSTLSPVPRYAVSTVLHFFTGLAFMFSIQAGFDIATLGGVGIFGQSPTEWPPMFDRPLSSDSIHSFWGQRWHQLLRQCFLVGAYPCHVVFGYPGLVFGAFLTSGLFHYWGTYCMGKGTDWRILAFFVAQAPIMFMERLWRKVTGRRVGGWPGMIWTYLWIVGFGQICSDGLHMRGIAGDDFIPPYLSVAKRFILPPLVAAIKAQWN